MQTHAQATRTHYFWSLLAIAALLLSVATVYAQVEHVTVHFLKTQQDKVHEQMLAGVAGNPWQYRILADWMVEPLIRLLVECEIPSPKAGAYIAFRFLQCLLIFLTGGVYYKKIGLPLTANLLGLSMLAWSMSYSLYNSDLSLSVFFDIAFYLIAANLILDRKFAWIPLLTILAALNRETSLLIPFMLAGFVLFIDKSQKPSWRESLYVSASLVLYLIVFAGLRLSFGEQKFLTADGLRPGISLLWMNLRRGVTWESLLITLGIIPVLAICAYQKWPKAMRIFFWVITPAWFAVHFFAAIVAETRLLLVPQTLIFIPGALLGIAPRENKPQDAEKKT